MENLAASCAHCDITNDIIDKQSFSCYSESPSFVMYRARLEGTSEIDSGSLISLIEEWVRRGGASVIVTGVLLKVDPNCPVSVTDTSEEQCMPPAPFPGTVSDADGSAPSNVIVGVVVAVVALTITVSVIVVVLLKKTVRRYAFITPNLAL